MRQRCHCRVLQQTGAALQRAKAYRHNRCHLKTLRIAFPQEPHNSAIGRRICLRSCCAPQDSLARTVTAACEHAHCVANGPAITLLCVVPQVLSTVYSSSFRRNRFPRERGLLLSLRSSLVSAGGRNVGLRPHPQADSHRGSLPDPAPVATLTLSRAVSPIPVAGHFSVPGGGL